MRYSIVRVVATFSAAPNPDSARQFLTENLSAVGAHHFISSNYTRTNHTHTPHMQSNAAIAIWCIFNYLFVFHFVLLLRRSMRWVFLLVALHFIQWTTLNRCSFSSSLLWARHSRTPCHVHNKSKIRRKIGCKLVNLHSTVRVFDVSICQVAVCSTYRFFFVLSIFQRKLNWLHFNCIDCSRLCGALCEILLNCRKQLDRTNNEKSTERTATSKFDRIWICCFFLLSFEWQHRQLQDWTINWTLITKSDWHVHFHLALPLKPLSDTLPNASTVVCAPQPALNNVVYGCSYVR